MRNGMIKFKEQIYSWENSPGLVPNGVSGSPSDGLTVKGSYFQSSLGTPLARNLVTLGTPGTPWARHGLILSIFEDFKSICGRSKKHCFLASHQNVKESRYNRSLLAPCPQKGRKCQLLASLFALIFQHLPKWLKVMKSTTVTHFQWF
jgi:hypothetical protein